MGNIVSKRLGTAGLRQTIYIFISKIILYIYMYYIHGMSVYNWCTMVRDTKNVYRQLKCLGNCLGGNTNTEYIPSEWH